MKRTNLVTHALALAFFAGALACEEDPNGNGIANGNGGPDLGPADTGDTTDMGGGDPDMGEPDGGQQEGPCYLELTSALENGCPSGQVCNFLTGECTAGLACDNDNDCSDCEEPSSGEACGHGAHLTAYCSAEHGGVCVRSKANCEPCETDADCGILSVNTGLSNADRNILCLEYDDGEKYCGASGRNGCPLGFERNDEGRCVNPTGCQDLFFCPVYDAEDDPDTDEYEGDGVADFNPTCDLAGQQTICFDEQCEGSGGLTCAAQNLPGIVEVCTDFCQSDADCADTPSTPFCATRTGVCKSGCVPGECPLRRDEDDCDGDGDEDEMVQTTCYADGDCGCPCTDDSFCADIQAPPPEGTNQPVDTYCNLPGLPTRPDQRMNETDEQFEIRAQQYLQAFPRVFKSYHDSNSCQQLGCELGPDEFVNRDCPSNRACDPLQAPYPACVDGCYRGGPFVEGGDCKSSGELGSSAICADAVAGDVQTKDACRNADFLGDDNREDLTLGACCDAGCLTRGGQCGPNRFCCEEIDILRIEEGKSGIGPYPLGDGGACLSRLADQPASGQAEGGDCFEPRNDVFCRTCTPGSAAACNGFEFPSLNIPAPGPDTPNQDMYDHQAVWPYGLNTLAEDTMRINGGNPFPELQFCVDVDPAMGPQDPGVCSVSFDPAKGDPGAPNGWECGALTAGCSCEADQSCPGCGGLECVGFQDNGDGTYRPGACKCGEGGEVTSACPSAITDAFGGSTLDMGDSNRMRCVERRDPYLTNVPESDEGDFYCVWTYTCTPPQFDTMDDGYRTFPATCGVQERL